MNDFNKPFTARWVNIIDPNNEIVTNTVVYGDDILVKNWKELAELVDENHQLTPGYAVEFQTYQLDENEEVIDSTIEDFRIDWVEGQPRLMKILVTGD